MSLEKFYDELAKGVSWAIGDFESEIGASFRRECFGLFNLARSRPDGILTPTDLSEYPDGGGYVYARMLESAGFLESRGGKMAPIDYILTDKGRKA